MVLTGSREEENLISDCLASGAQDFLSKDRLDKESIVRAIHFAVGRMRFFADTQKKEQDSRYLLDSARLARLSSEAPSLVSRRLYGQRPLANRTRR